MIVTIKDVARKAGVSIVTVSRAFSNTHPVAEATRRKIFEAAEELGYVPHLMARALVSKHTPMIGVMIIDLSNPFFAPIVDAVQEVAWQEGYMAVFNQSKYQLQLEETSIEQFRQMRMAGILIVSVLPDMKHLQRLRQEGMNVVALARRWDEGDYVAVDYFVGGQMAGQHLIRLGHRQIACVAHAEHFRGGLWSRIQGFRAALEDSEGPGFSEDWMIWTEAVGVAEGMRAADVVLALPQRPTAAFVTADHLAVGFVHRLRQQGVRVPEDVAVVSHDDIRYAEFMEVPLTTVALPKYEIGRQAAQILFERIKEGRPQAEDLRQILLKPELVVRTSCGSSLIASRGGLPMA